MALVNRDRVLETSTTTGTGTYTLAGAVTGFQDFSVVGNGNTCHYAAWEVDGSGNPSGGWETGIGTYTASGTTLARTTVIASSNAGAAVSWAAGTRRIAVSPLSSKVPTLDADNSFTAAQTVSWGGFTLSLGADNNASTRTNTTTKITRMTCPHYTNSEEPLGLLIATSTVNSNEISYGGDSSIVNAATLIKFFTGATNTTTDGSERMRINSTGQVGIGTDNSTVLALAAMQAALCLNDAATNSASVHTSFTHRTSGTPAAGYGSELRFYLESTTTEYVDAGGIVNAWTVATHASRSSEFKLYAVTNAAARAEVARFDGGGGATPTAGNTGMMLWDVDNATLERVTVGVADSGGTGFKVLRIPN